MYSYAMFRGLGDTSFDPYDTSGINDPAIPATSAPAAPAPSFLDKLTSVFNTGSNLVSKGVSTITSIKSLVSSPSSSQPAAPGTPAYQQQQVAVQNAKAATAMSTGAKIGIALGILALGGGVIYLVTKKK